MCFLIDTSIPLSYRGELFGVVSCLVLFKEHAHWQEHYDLYFTFVVVMLDEERCSVYWYSRSINY